jgi:signal transduction histidine kinase
MSERSGALGMGYDDEQRHVRAGESSFDAAEGATAHLQELEMLRKQRDEEREKRLALEAAVRAHENLLAIVAHDLRGPLGVTLMKASLLLSHLPDSDVNTRVRRDLEVIERSGKRMEYFIRDLLELANIEAGRVKLERQPQPVRRILTAATDAMRPFHTLKAQTLNVDLEDEALTISCDRERVVHAVANAVARAIRATPESGSISLRARSNGDQVEIIVTDQGPAVDPAEAHLLFSRYWQAGVRDMRGTGIGPFVAKGLVEAHGGRVWLEPVAATGTRMCISLPVA